MVMLCPHMGKLNRQAGRVILRQYGDGFSSEIFLPTLMHISMA